MKKIGRNHISDQVFQILSSRIIRLEYDPGQIIFETQISKEFGISRSPVRDALHRLERILFVTRTPKGAYQVTDMTGDFIHHFYETVVIIYTNAFRAAAIKADASVIARLEKALSVIEQGVEAKDISTYLNGVTTFGSIALEAWGNPIIERFALELMPTAERIQWLTMSRLPGAMAEAAAHIKKGLESIRSQQPDKTADAFTSFATVHRDIALEAFYERKNNNTSIKVKNGT